MRLDRFDLNLLITLDALLETRNVTRASEQLHIGQSACSSALARLRDYFGDDLLVPTGRQLLLTPLAEALRNPVSEALFHARKVIIQRPDFDPETAQETFEVCGSDYAVAVLLAPLARRLANSAPGIMLRIRSAPGDLFSAFERGQLDCMIVPSGLNLPIQSTRQKIFSDTLVALVSSETSLSENAQLTIEQLAQHEHVAVRLGGIDALTLAAWEFPELHGDWRVACTVDRFHLAPLFVIGTSRITILPRRLAQSLVQRDPLQILELPETLLTQVEFDLVWPRHVDKAPAHIWLRQQLLEAANLSENESV